MCKGSAPEKPGQVQTLATNNSPSYTVQDGFYLLEIHGGTSLKWLMIFGFILTLGIAARKLYRHAKRKERHRNLKADRLTNRQRRARTKKCWGDQVWLQNKQWPTSCSNTFGRMNQCFLLQRYASKIWQSRPALHSQDSGSSGKETLHGDNVKKQSSIPLPSSSTSDTSTTSSSSSYDSDTESDGKRRPTLGITITHGPLEEFTPDDAAKSLLQLSKPLPLPVPSWAANHDPILDTYDQIDPVSELFTGHPMDKGSWM